MMSHSPQNAYITSQMAKGGNVVWGESKRVTVELVLLINNATHTQVFTILNMIFK